MMLLHFARRHGDDDLENGLCQVHGDQRIVLHEVGSFLSLVSNDFGTLMPIKSSRGVHLINAADERQAHDRSARS
jgi:hypothetical protein